MKYMVCISLLVMAGVHANDDPMQKLKEVGNTTLNKGKEAGVKVLRVVQQGADATTKGAEALKEDAKVLERRLKGELTPVERINAVVDDIFDPNTYAKAGRFVINNNNWITGSTYKKLFHEHRTGVAVPAYVTLASTLTAMKRTRPFGLVSLALFPVAACYKFAKESYLKTK